MGGTFNPVHNAHLLIAQKAQAQYGLNRIIFITSGNPPHKTAMTDARHRFNMTRLAISDNSSFIDDDLKRNLRIILRDKMKICVNKVDREK